MKIWISLLSAVLLGFALMTAGGMSTALAGEPLAEAKACADAQTAACGKCGDRRCTPQCGETAESCPRDCGVVSMQLACGKCGDGRCTPQCGESSQSCPKDCGVESQRIVAGAGY